MSWNIQDPGRYINGPLTVTGASSFQGNVGIGAATSGFGRLAVAGFAGGAGILGIDSDATRVDIQSYNKPLSINRQGNNVNFCEGGGNVGIAATAFGGFRFAIGNTSDTGAATNGFIIYTNRAVCSLVSNGAVDAAGTTFNYSWANGGQGPFIIGYAGGEAARFNPGGTFILGGGNTAANGRGIAFPAAQSASTDANTLDDYEEGTFTPTVFGGTSAGAGTYSVQVGRYTKIGNRVTVDVYLNWTNHTGTGDIRFGGLPFASRNAANYYASMTLGYVSSLTYAAGYFLTALIPPNGSSVELSQTQTNGGIPVGVPMDTSAAIVFSISYEV